MLELADHAASRCGHCGQFIWIYATPGGHKVALDNAPGPYVINGTKAYRSSGRSGYRGHWDHCRHPALYSSRTDVAESEFLWR